MVNTLIGFLLGWLFVRQTPALITTHQSDNHHSISANAVSNGTSTSLPTQGVPVIVYVNIPPQAQVSSAVPPSTPNTPAQPAQPAAPVAPVGPPPQAVQPNLWPYIAAIVALAAILMASLWVDSMTDPMGDLNAVVAMGGNEVVPAEFSRSVRNDGDWTPVIRYDYDSTVLSLHDVKGATFAVAPGWEMQTDTDQGLTTFRGGERHRSEVAFFRRDPNSSVLFWQRLFHR